MTRYARSKGVQLIGHHETGGNIGNYESQLDNAMKLYSSLGMNSVKTGYVAHIGGIIAPGDKPGEIRMEYHEGQVQVRHLQKVNGAAGNTSTTVIVSRDQAPAPSPAPVVQPSVSAGVGSANGGASAVIGPNGIEVRAGGASASVRN